MSQDKLVAGRYRYIRSLGRGGFSDVCLAEDVRLGGRYVAIKRIAYHLLHDPERLEKFQQEAEIIGRLTSPFTVRAFDYGKDDEGRYFIVMEYVEGQTLHRALANEGPFTVERSLQIGVQLLDALEEAHDQGIIHRDLKPKNIILAPSRQGDLVKVLDFGVARILDPEEESDDWTLVGTASYMAPEQAQGKPVSPASDLYSVGVLLYHALTGKPPFVSREDPVAVMIHHATKPVQPMREARPDLDLPEELDKIILRALEKQPSRRYTSASSFRDALEEILINEQIEEEELNDTYQGAHSSTSSYGTDPEEEEPTGKVGPSHNKHETHATLPTTQGVQVDRPFAWPPQDPLAQTHEDKPDNAQSADNGLILTGTNPENPSANTAPDTPAIRSGTLHAHLPPPPMIAPAGASSGTSPRPVTPTMALGGESFHPAAPPRAGQPAVPALETNSFEGHGVALPSSHSSLDALPPIERRDEELPDIDASGGPTPAKVMRDELITASSISQSSIISRGMIDLDKELDQALEMGPEPVPPLPEDDINTAQREEEPELEEDMLQTRALAGFENEHQILDALMESAPELPSVEQLDNAEQEGLPSTLDLKPNTPPKNKPTHTPTPLQPPTPKPEPPKVSPYSIASPIQDIASMSAVEEPTDDDWELEVTAQTTIQWEGLDVEEGDATMSLGPGERTARHNVDSLQDMDTHNSHSSHEALSAVEDDLREDDTELPTDPDNDPNSTMLDISVADIDEHTLEPTESTHQSPFYMGAQATPQAQPTPAFAPQQFRDPFALGPADNATAQAPHTMSKRNNHAPTPVPTPPPNPVDTGPVASWDLPQAFLEPEDASATKSPQELGFNWSDQHNDYDSGEFGAFQQQQRLKSWGLLGAASFLVALVILLASAGEGKDAQRKRYREQAYKDALKAGDKAINQGKYNSAYASYRQALKLKPNDRTASHRLHITQLDLEANSLLKRAIVLERQGQLLQAYRLLQQIDTKASLWEERGKKSLIRLHHLILKRLGKQIIYYRRKRRWRLAHARCKILPQFYNKHPLLQRVCPYVKKRMRRRR